MTKIEQIEFENIEKFNTAIEKVLNGEEVYRSYEKDGETRKKKIISKNRLYINNNYSISLKEAENKKVYLSIDYFTVENRFDLAKKDKVEQIDL